MASRDSRLNELSQLYDLLITTIAGSDGQILGLDIRQVNQRILYDVSQNISQPISSIKSTVTEGVSTARDVASSTTSFPSQVSAEVNNLPTKLGLQKIANIPFSINKLLAALHTAIEDPTTLYPRLICCDAPLDPAKIANFAKRHRVLQRLDNADIMLQTEDRSLPTAPKSAMDVLTNINTSFESLSDKLKESVSAALTIQDRFIELAAVSTDVHAAKEPVDEILSKQQDVSTLIDRIRSVFGDDDTTTRAVDRALKEQKSPVDYVRETTSLADGMNTSAGVFDDLVPRIRNVGGTLTELGKNLEKLFNKGMKLFQEFVAVLKRLLAKLPSMIRELQQFFMPTGLRELIMRPSSDLLTLIGSIETLKSDLPSSEGIERSAKEAFEESGTVSKVDNLKGMLEHMVQFPQQLSKMIKESDLVETIIESMKSTLKKILNELKGSLVGDAADLIGDALGVSNFSDKIDDMLPFQGDDGNKHMSGGRNDKNGGGGLAGLVNNVTQAGGLFGKLF